MTENDKKLPPNLSPPIGQNRRNTVDQRKSQSHETPSSSPKATGTISHDDLGNATWNSRVDVPRRRKDDKTIDLLKCLQVDDLSIEDDEDEKPEEDAFNPYNKQS